MIRRFFLTILFIAPVFALSAQPDHRNKAPYRIALATNPLLPIFGQFQLTGSCRFHPRQAVGVELTGYTRAFHRGFQPDSLPESLSDWQAAKGYRLFLHYKYYPLYNRNRLQVSGFFISAQVMYRRLSFERVPLTYRENNFSYYKEVREFREAGRLDFALGYDYVIGRHFLLGAFWSTGLGLEHRQQFNLKEHDTDGLFPPGVQFLEDEPDFFQNLIGFRLGLAIGIVW